MRDCAYRGRLNEIVYGYARPSAANKKRQWLCARHGNRAAFVSSQNDERPLRPMPRMQRSKQPRTARRVGRRAGVVVLLVYEV